MHCSVCRNPSAGSAPTAERHRSILTRRPFRRVREEVSVGAEDSGPGREVRAEVWRGGDGTADGLLIYLRRRGIFAHHVTLAENGDFLASFERRVGSAVECEHLL